MRCRKVYKQTARYTHKKVSNVKPYPIPDLEGEAAKDFEKKICRPLTQAQKKKNRDATLVYSQTKRKE